MTATLFPSRRRTAAVASACAALSVLTMIGSLGIRGSLRLRRSPGNLAAGGEHARVLKLGTDGDADALLAAEDDPTLLPRPPPSRAANNDDGPLPPYSLEDVLQAAPLFRDVFAVVVFDPAADAFVAHYSNSMRWVAGCHKLIGSLKVTINSLRILFPERFNKDAPEFALAVSSGDYPGLNWNDCLRRGRSDCLVDGDGNELRLGPILHYGSVFQQSLLPSMIGMPLPQNNHLWCYHSWALQEHLCQYYLPRGEDNPLGLVFEESIGVGWDDLIPQVVWRGTDFSYLHKMNPTLRQPNFELDVASQIDLSARVDKKTAATQAMRQVYDELIPRWKGVVWTAEAEREAEALDRRRFNRQRRAQNGRARRDVLETKKRARAPANGRERRPRRLNGQMGSLEKAVPWCNVKFAAAPHLGKKTPTKQIESYMQFEEFGIPAAGEGMSLEELGRYKYHIDIGGGGGTTWSGTLEKLALPGLLFHHVTPTRDYLHDALAPWVHYVPIKEDLSDLKEKFAWAESHPEMAKAISDNATAFARRLGTQEGMAEFAERFYIGPLRRVVEAYRPLKSTGGKRWQDVVRSMTGDDMRPIMRCKGRHQHDCEQLADDLQFTRLH